MQTKVLTHQVRGYTARTIYRHLPRLAALGVVERDECPEGPTRIVNTLVDGRGTELCDLVGRFASSSMTQLPNGQVDAAAWSSLGLLADLWEAGAVDELSRGSRSPTELARGLDSLSYHQVNRRASRFSASGFLCERDHARTQRRCYALTDKTRRTMALVAGIGRWRHRHLATGRVASSAGGEVEALLRACLPLARIPQHAGRAMAVHIAFDGGVAEVWMEVDAGGAVHAREVPSTTIDGWAEADTEGWLTAIVDRKDVSAGGDRELVDDCLHSLYERLWTPSPF